MATKWIEFTESDTATKKRPEGRTRLVRADSIETISDNYEGGGCTISVSGYHYHVTMNREDIVEEIDTRGGGPKPATPVGYV